MPRQTRLAPDQRAELLHALDAAHAACRAAQDRLTIHSSEYSAISYALYDLDGIVRQLAVDGHRPAQEARRRARKAG
jgi:hypothetical protein